MNPFRCRFTATVGLLAVFCLCGRADDSTASVTGGWKINYTLPNGSPVGFKSQFKQEGTKLTGTMSFNGATDSTPITDGSITNNDLRFTITRQRTGRTITQKFEGHYDGEKISGKLEANFQNTPAKVRWEGKRLPDPTKVTGTWRWTSATPGAQALESTLKLKQAGTQINGAVLSRNGPDAPIANGVIQGDAVSFDLTRERDDKKFVFHFHGKFAGERIKGEIESEFLGEKKVHPWEAARSED